MYEEPLSPSTSPIIPPHRMVGALAAEVQEQADGQPSVYDELPRAAQALDLEPDIPFAQIVDRLSTEIQSGQFQDTYLDAGRVVARVLFDLEAKEAAAKLARSATDPEESADRERREQIRWFKYNSEVVKGYYCTELIGAEAAGGTLERLEGISGHIPSFAFLGQARPGTEMQAGTAPTLDLYHGPDPNGIDPQPKPDEMTAGSPLDSAINRSADIGPAAQLHTAIREAVVPDRIFDPLFDSEDTKHFLAFLPAGDPENTFVSFSCWVSSNGDHRWGKQGAIVTRVLELGLPEAGFVYGCILRQPNAFMTFLDVVSPGLDYDYYLKEHPQETRARNAYGPWLSTFRADEGVVFLDYKVLRGTFEALYAADQLYDIGSLRYADLWAAATTRIPPKPQQ